MKCLRILVISLLCLITTSSFAQSLTDPVNVTSTSGTVTIGHVNYVYSLTTSTKKGTATVGGKKVVGLEGGLTGTSIIDELFLLSKIYLIYGGNEYEVSVTEVYTCAFQNSNRLRKVFVQSGFTFFQNKCFENSTVTELWIPGNGLTLGVDAFGGCDDLENVYVQDDKPASEFNPNAYTGIADNVIFNIPCGAFNNFLEQFATSGRGDSGGGARFPGMPTDHESAEYEEYVEFVKQFMNPTPLAEYYVTAGAAFADGISDLSRGKANVTSAYCQEQRDEDKGTNRWYDVIKVTATELDPAWKFAYWIDNNTGETFVGETDPKTYEIRIYYTIDSDGNPIYEDLTLVNNIKNNIYTAYFVEAPRIIDTKTGTVAGYTNEEFVAADNNKHYGSIDIYCYGNTVPEITAEPGVQVQTRAVNVIREFDASRVFYFSLPFDCDYDHITVTKNGVDCKSQYDTDGNFDTTNDKDVWSLYKFNEDIHSKNQDFGIDAWAYERITDPSTFTLKRGVGYAFVVIGDPSDANNKVKVTFNKKNANGELFNFFDKTSGGFTISEGITYTTNDIRDVNDNDSYIGWAYSGWNLVGNPFFATISETNFQVGKENPTDEERYAGYISKLNESTNNFERSRTLRESNVPAFKALFVKANKPNSTATGTLAATIPVSSPYTSSSSKVRDLYPERNIVLSLSRLGEYCDMTTVVLNRFASLAFDPDEDLAKIVEPGAAVIYSIVDNIKCEFDVLNLDSNFQVVNLGVKVWQNGSFTFALDTKKSNFPGSVVLVDNKMNTRTDLANSKYTVNLSRGDIDGRFYLEVEIPEEARPESFVHEDIPSEITTHVNSGILHVDGISELALVYVYDASGKRVASALSADSCEFTLQQHGVYFVSVNGVTSKVVY